MTSERTGVVVDTVVVVVVKGVVVDVDSVVLGVGTAGKESMYTLKLGCKIGSISPQYVASTLTWLSSKTQVGLFQGRAHNHISLASNSIFVVTMVKIKKSYVLGGHCLPLQMLRMFAKQM